MKYLGLVVLLFSCSSINAQVDIPELDRLLEYGEVESLDITFEQISCSDEFIDVFKLNKKELEMVGFWDENYTVKLNQTSSGVRILGIDIYPNRIMNVGLERIESGERSQSLLFSLWKIESKALLIQPLFLLNRGSDQTIFTAESIMELHTY